LPVFEEDEKTFHIKELNEDADKKGCKEVTPTKIKTIINFWAIKNWIKRHNEEYSKNHVVIIYIQPKESLKEKLEKRHELARFLVEFLYEKSNLTIAEVEKEKEVLVEFSVHELKDEFEKRPKLLKLKFQLKI
jgi:ATP-dependent DNA helicase RecQ